MNNIENKILSVEQARYLQNTFHLDMSDAAICYVRLSPVDEWNPTLTDGNCKRLSKSPMYHDCYCFTYTLEEVLNKIPKEVSDSLREGTIKVTFGTLNLDVDYQLGKEWNYCYLDTNLTKSLLQSAYSWLVWYLKNIQSGFYVIGKEEKSNDKSDPIAEDVIAIMAKVLDVSPQELTPTFNLAEYADSLDQVDIVINIEKKFNIIIPDEDLFTPKWEHPTVKEVIEYVQSKVKKPWKE